MNRSTYERDVAIAEQRMRESEHFQTVVRRNQHACEHCSNRRLAQHKQRAERIRENAALRDAIATGKVVQIYVHDEFTGLNMAARS